MLMDNEEKINQKSNNYEFDNSGFKSKDYEDSDEFDIWDLEQIFRDRVKILQDLNTEFWDAYEESKTTASGRREDKKERLQPFVIKGKENNWNNLTTKEKESKLTIRDIEKKKIKENEEELLFNDDYNMIKENHIRPIFANIKKVQEIFDESISTEIDVLRNIKIYNGQFDQYKDKILDSIRISSSPQNVIINDISRKYPKRIETYYEKDEEEEENGNNDVVIVQNQPNKRQTYSKKIITTYQKNQINKKIISYPQANFVYK